MSKYVTYANYSNGIGTVNAIINGQYEQQPNGILTDENVPAVEDIPNMDAYLRIKLDTGEFYYDYIARETFETKVSDLETENAELKQAIADLTMTMAAMMA